MSRRSTWLAWGLASLAIALHLVGHLFVVLGIGIGTPGDEETTVGGVGFLVAFYVFPLVGAVIATRRPEHAIGWLFLAGGVVLGLSDGAASYADYALYADPGRLPAGNWAAWTVSLLDPSFAFCIVLLLLLFPEGRLASRRWRLVLGALVAAVVAVTVTTAIKPGLVFDQSLPVENPAGIGGVEQIREMLSQLGSAVLLMVAILAIFGAVLRYRRTRGVERQQFKWFAFAAGLLLASMVVMPLTALGVPDQLAVALIGSAFAGVALAVGVAILRYRLYEIDRVISKTLVYGSLTVILGVAYSALVLAAQAVFSSFAGGSNLAIAASTFVVAVLFLPMRARVQRFVDRRFFRRRYDARGTLETFGTRVRDHIELNALCAELEGVVHDTMQPAHVSVWLSHRGRS